MALPLLTAISVPFTTLTTESSLETHLIFSVVLEGLRVAISVSVAPTGKVISVLLRVTLDKGIVSTSP